MSDPDRPEREWRFYIDDMIEFAQNAQPYTNGMNQAEFIADRRTFDATLRHLELIGEAAGNIYPTSTTLAGQRQLEWPVDDECCG